MNNNISPLMVHHYDQYTPIYRRLIDNAITQWRRDLADGQTAVQCHDSMHCALHEENVSWEQLANFAQFCIERLANQS